jgi:hypothetical protein
VSPIMEMGTILGFFDPAGFDRLLLRCTSAASGDPNLQALALDNLRVDLHPHNIPAVSGFGLGLIVVLVGLASAFALRWAAAAKAA